MRWERMAFLLLAAVIAGCGFFSTRSPVAPSDPPNIPYRNPTDPDSVLFNYAAAAAFGTKGSGQVSDTMDLSYLLVLDPDDSVTLNLGSMTKGSFNAAYDAAMKEQQFVGLDTFYFAFEDKEPVVGGGEARYENIAYEFQVLERRGSGAEPVATYKGTADILLIDKGSAWVLVRWFDSVAEPGFLTWGWYNGSKAVSSSPKP